MAKFDISGFVRDCYLHAEPSVDLREVPEGQQVKGWEHKLKMSVYNRLLQKWGVTDADDKPIDKDVFDGVNFFCMDKGPSWVDDLNTKAA